MASGSPASEYERWHLSPRAYWLPPHGHGNGLDAVGWAPIADVPAAYEIPLLTALRHAGIAAYAAAQRGGAVRFWVDSRRFRSAEDVFRHELADAERRWPP